MTAASPTSPSRSRAVGIGALALTALAVAVFAPLPYALHPLRDLAASGGEIATNFAERPGWARASFLVHIAAGGLALLLSPVQLSTRLRARAPHVHRAVGRITLVAIAAGGTAGLVLAPMSLAGAVGTAGFGALAVLWLAFAALGLRAIRGGDVTAHRRFMLRTFAMTYAAVTLRLWLLVLVPVLGDFPRAYAVVPFLSWVPNLVVVELLLRRQRPAAGRVPPLVGTPPRGSWTGRPS